MWNCESPRYEGRMKKRSRDINIFSVSALDLFASAMGAFILLSLIFVVFFMMTSRSSDSSMPDPTAQTDCPPLPEPPDPVACPTVPDTGALEEALGACREDLQAQQVVAASCEYQRQRLAERVTEIEFPHLDLVIALDTTGSMWAQVEGLKSEIDQLLDVLNKLAPSLGMGLVPFGDRLWQTPVFHQDILEVKRSRANREALKRVIGNLQIQMGRGTGGNPDGPEAVLAALNVAIASAWRPEAERRIIVVVTDNAAYPEEQAAALEAARAFAAQGEGRAVSVVVVDTSASAGAPAAGTVAFLRSLASAGVGEFVKDGGSMTANLLLSLL